MIVSHSGQQITASENPLEAVKLCLNASSGCGSYSKAWAWANDAVICAGYFREAFAEKLDIALHNSNDKWPDVKAALDVLEEAMGTQNNTFYISTHPSGGFLLGIPANASRKAHDVANLLAVWQNLPSIEGYTEYEFPRNWGEETFGFWVEQTFGLIVNDLKINRI